MSDDYHSVLIRFQDSDGLWSDGSALACAGSGVLSGYLTDATTGRPLAGVTISAGGLTAVTDGSGYYSIAGLPCGTHEVLVSVPGFETYRRTFNWLYGGWLDIRLTKGSTSIGITPTTPIYGDPVNTATGNYVYQRRDLELPGIGMPFRLDRSYNSRAASDAAASAAPLGYGWRHSYQIALAEAPDGVVTLTWGDGHTETHTPDGLGGYTPQYGVFDTLTDNGDGTFSLEKRDRTVYDFDTSGRLSAITDKNANTLALAYSGANLTQITDTAGRLITLDYDPSGRITLITDPIARTVQYAYDANGDLIGATDPNGNLTQYTYDAAHQILTVVDPRGNTVVTNTYDGANRVVTYQTDAKGNPTEYAYEELDRITTITDALGNVTVHHHDELLRLEKEVDARGGVAAVRLRHPRQPRSGHRQERQRHPYDYDDPRQRHAQDRRPRQRHHHHLRRRRQPAEPHRCPGQPHPVRLRRQRQPDPDHRRARQHRRHHLHGRRPARDRHRPQRQRHHQRLRRRGQPHPGHRRPGQHHRLQLRRGRAAAHRHRRPRARHQLPPTTPTTTC